MVTSTKEVAFYIFTFYKEIYVNLSNVNKIWEEVESMDKKLNPMQEDRNEVQDDWNVLNDITFWIGVALMGLGLLNGFTKVPDEFIIGASLGGLCFTVAGVLTPGGTYKRRISPFVAIGTLCLFLLPIIILKNPILEITEFLNSVSNMATFFALGIVISTLAFRSQDSKIKSTTMTIEYLEKISKDCEELKNIHRELEEKTKAHCDQFVKLKGEFDLLKAYVETNRVKEDSSE